MYCRTRGQILHPNGIRHWTPILGVVFGPATHGGVGCDVKWPSCAPERAPEDQVTHRDAGHGRLWATRALVLVFSEDPLSAGSRAGESRREGDARCGPPLWPQRGGVGDVDFRALAATSGDLLSLAVASCDPLAPLRMVVLKGGRLGHAKGGAHVDVPGQRATIPSSAYEEASFQRQGRCCRCLLSWQSS